MAPPAYDVVVVGSGFGGSVAALRLTEKGYRVAVVEAGARFDEASYAETSWDLRRFLWAPRLGCFGIQRISLLRDSLVLSGAGVGGGSLVYANTLYRPRPAFYSDPQWSSITDWSEELAPWLDQAERMLGVTTNPSITAADVEMRRVAGEMGVGDTFHLAPVGVYFGEPGAEVDDPFFGGAGPRRSGCVSCGGCMTGCRFGAKNTLTKNYLYLAEAAGAEIRPLRTVTSIRPVGGGGYEVVTRPSGRGGGRETLAASQVVLAAGTLGTQKLLQRMKVSGILPDLSERLGFLTRTNSEAILGARTHSPRADFSRGVAITSAFHLDPDTQVEPVRYARGSNAMGLLATALADRSEKGRVGEWARSIARDPVATLRNLSLRRWSEQTIIALVMQSLDNSITLTSSRRRFGRVRLTSVPGSGEPAPRWIPAGHKAVRLLAANIGGVPQGGWNDVFDVPMTAHLIGGAVIGAAPADGVVDAYQRVFGHPGLHVADGSALSANLGVNPALTITAQAERAMSMWPEKGRADPRPPLGEPYIRVAPVRPSRPAVPADAPAALRYPAETTTSTE